jgi:hypothetical protein
MVQRTGALLMKDVRTNVFLIVIELAFLPCLLHHGLMYKIGVPTIVADPGSRILFFPSRIPDCQDPWSGSESTTLVPTHERHQSHLFSSFHLCIFVNFKITTFTKKIPYFLDVIRICEPTTVVQIYSRFHRKVLVLLPTFLKQLGQILSLWYLHT